MNNNCPSVNFLLLFYLIFDELSILTYLGLFVVIALDMVHGVGVLVHVWLLHWGGW